MDTMSDSNNTTVWADIICCPDCYGQLKLVVNEHLDKQCLQCSKCKAEFPGVAYSFDMTITEGER